MSPLIRKAIRKQNPTLVLQWDGTEEQVAMIKRTVAPFETSVFYVGPHDYHESMTLLEKRGSVYYNPYLYLQCGFDGIRVEKDQLLLLQTENSNADIGRGGKGIRIISEADFLANYEILVEERPEPEPEPTHVVEVTVNDEAVLEESLEEEVRYDVEQNDDQADGS